MATSRWDIAQRWRNNQRFVPDLGEPACFACGYFDPDWDEPETPQLRWNSCKLERAHIIGKSIGGEDVANNYLLLCRACHLEAPMTNQRDWMLNWAKSRPSYEETWCRRFIEGVELAGGNMADLEWGFENDLLSFKAIQQTFKELQADSHIRATNTVATAVAVVLQARWQAPLLLPKAA